MLVTEPLEPLSVPVSITFSSKESSSHAPPSASTPPGSARVPKALQRPAEGTGTRMQAEPWKGTHLFCPSPPRLGVAGCGRLPAHSLPCASAALLAGEPRDGAKSPPLPSRSLPRGARFGRRPPRAWHPAGGAGSDGNSSCHLPPCPQLQLATLRPQPGLLMPSWQRQQERYQRFGFSG